MVSRTNPRRRQLPRDEIVERGVSSRGSHNHPWDYGVKVKSGTRRTQQINTTAYNQSDLFGQMIASHGRRGEDLFIFNVVRVAKRQCRSKDY